MKEFELTKIFDSMKHNDISELIIKEGSKLYEIRRGGFKQNIVAGSGQPMVQTMPQGQVQITQPVIQQPQHISSATTSSKDVIVDKKDEKTIDNLYDLKSPLVGTFYASPKPDAPAFVELGDKVKKGQTLCIVEAMKNFNEIESEVDGIIREICVKNQELVEFGKVLFKIELT